MTTNPLDRPVWASLASAHAGLSVGNPLARRYTPDVNRFASACDDSDAAMDALAGLVPSSVVSSSVVPSSDQVFILQVPRIRIPMQLLAVRQATGVQLIAHAPVAAADDGTGDIIALGDSDADEMLALATLTEPGPFVRRTPRMGSFFGIRIEGRLAAMAGERFRFPGHTEVSGVCTHPDFRGRGLARRLSRHVAAGIAARGEVAFLHAWKSNLAAISLYEKLGFRLRTEVNVAVLARRTADPG